MKYYILMILLPACISFYSSRAVAAPDGADLLEACRYSMQHGFDGTPGKMCHWYVMPCDCHHGKEPAPPRVCLPASIPIRTLAQEVIYGLQERPELLQEHAGYAAATILSVHYPCSEVE